MEVINVKVKYIRPEYANLKEWMADPQNAYIGRRGIVFIDGARFPLTDSPYANPFKITANSTRDDVIEQYREYIMARIENEPEFAQQMRTDLAGKKLGCWCCPESCHGDVLMEILAD